MDFVHPNDRKALAREGKNLDVGKVSSGPTKRINNAEEGSWVSRDFHKRTGTTLDK